MDRLSSEDRGPIALAEKILALLDEGRFTATYKYAVLLGLLDLCLELATDTGAAPEMITTRQLAEKVVEIYWPQSAPFDHSSSPEPHVLIQSGGGRDSQAEILRRIVRFRQESAPDPSIPLYQALLNAKREFECLVRFVEWKLIQMPLPRLQYFGNAYEEFLYTLSWDTSVRRRHVSEYQRDGGGPFDNRILLRPRVGDHLVMLSGLLRPLFHRQWAAMVAQMNQLEEARLEAFLFGAQRIPLEPIRPALQDLQGDRCFYCAGLFQRVPARRPEVDHFVPWVRYPNNAIENLVVAHESCNNHKRDFLAATPHLVRWRGRLDADWRTRPELARVARDARWESDADRSVRVARAIYLRLSPGAWLWSRGGEFAVAEPDELKAALAG